jgi:predicted small lipoprotein YifL
MKPVRSVLLLLVLALTLLGTAACGNKGELVRPEPTPDASAGS